jgi:hypothetical protein
MGVTEQLAELAARVDAREAENQALPVRLDGEGSAEAAEPTASAAVGPAPVSRRHLLGRLGGMAAAATAGAMVAGQLPAAAAQGDDMVVGSNNIAGSDTTTLNSSTSLATLILYNYESPNTGLPLLAVAGPGLTFADYLPAIGPGIGVLSSRSSHALFWARGTGNDVTGYVADLTGASGTIGARLSGSVVGVDARSPVGTGVYGRAGTTGGVNTGGLRAGVYGDGDGGAFGVIGTSVNDRGVYGRTNAADAVYGQRGGGSGLNPGQFAGVRGDGNSGAAGVLGTSAASEGVRGLSTSGSGVKGESSSGAGVLGTSAGDGVRGVSSGGTGVAGQYTGTGSGVGVGGVGKGTSVGSSGVIGSVDGGASGAAGTAGVVGVNFNLNDQGVGVRGQHSSGGVGVQGSSHLGPSVRAATSPLAGAIPGGRLLIDPRSSVGAPAAGTFVKGEFMVDSAGVVWVCTTGGTGAAAKWSKVAFGGGTQLLAEPIRVLDTRGGAPLTNGGKRLAVDVTVTLPITGTDVGGVSVPAGATGIVASLAATDSLGPGFLKLFPAQLAGTGTSIVNFAAGQTIANACTVALSPSGTVKIQAGGSATHAILDITGYLM